MTSRSFETISAYADGEIDLTELRKRISTGEEEMASELSGIEHVDREVRRAFHRPDDANYAELVAVVERGFRPTIPPKVRLQWLLPLAASVIVGVVGVAIAIVLADQRAAGRIANFQQEILSNEKALLAALSNALETKESGIEVDFRNAGTGLAGRVRPVRTFPNAQGQWCREFAETIYWPGGPEIRTGIACRSDGGEWNPVLISEGSGGSSPGL